jgi:hypothetical protein
MSQTSMMPLAQPGKTGAELTVERPQNGFSILLDELTSGISGTDTLKVIVRRLLTLEERQSFAFGLRSLTPRQSALLHLLGGVIPQHQPLSSDTESSLWHVGIWDYGRILLTDNPPDQRSCRSLVYLSVSDEISRQIELRVQEAERTDAKFESEMGEFFENIDDQQKHDILESVWHGLDHIDPVLIYVNDSTFTNFDTYNNLVTKAGSLLERFGDAQAGLLADEKRFIFCFYWILQAGLRGEEFNGVQLTPRLLDTHLNSCIRHYSNILGRDRSECADSIADKARYVRTMRQEIGRDYFTFRFVNGLNFYKEERLAPRAALRDRIEELPGDLQGYIEDTFNLNLSLFCDLNDLFRACVEKASRANLNPSDMPMSDIELLLRKIVVSAVESLHSDIGMTRGIRNIQRWQTAVYEQRYGNICEWPTGDYFCGVFPSTGMRQRFRDDLDRLRKILIACSVRMQFNSWHYMPGHFPRELIPPKRHFYYPPRMPDTAIWSDQHHAGHVKAGVRFAIRSPAPLVYRKQVYYGMVDLRLYRATGPPYTSDELFKAIKYTEYLRAVYQAIADNVESTGREIVIKSFAKQWYELYGAACFDKRESSENGLPIF